MIASIPQWILLVCMLIAAGHDPDRGGEVGGPALCESGSMQFQDLMGIWAMTMIDVIMILRSLSYRILLSFGFEWKDKVITTWNERLEAEYDGNRQWSK
jgi:hypothetical protein